jgi:hypothetical protein
LCCVFELCGVASSDCFSENFLRVFSWRILFFHGCSCIDSQPLCPPRSMIIVSCVRACSNSWAGPRGLAHEAVVVDFNADAVTTPASLHALLLQPLGQHTAASTTGRAATATRSLSKEVTKRRAFKALVMNSSSPSVSSAFERPCSLPNH